MSSVEKYTCPWCDNVNDRHLSLQEPDAVPKPGDALVCADCSGVSMVTESNKVRKPTEQEWERIFADERIHLARKMMFFESKRGREYHDFTPDGWNG